MLRSIQIEYNIIRLFSFDDKNLCMFVYFIFSIFFFLLLLLSFVVVVVCCLCCLCCLFVFCVFRCTVHPCVRMYCVPGSRYCVVLLCCFMLLILPLSSWYFVSHDQQQRERQFEENQKIINTIEQKHFH